MRKIIALLTIFSLNAYAVAPTGVGGEQGALSYTNNLKAPNYQVTSLGGVNSRIESGNTNLLMNPSFEHTTVYTGWTINGGTAPPFTNATVTENITNQVEGKKAISIAPSAALTFGQDSTVNAANLTGLQGVASVKIKATGTTGLKVCPRNAGSVITNLCVNVTADNTWKHISIPFILGVTSNGIGIATTATGGTVIIDDAFVGTSAPFQDVSGARLVGTVTMSNCSAPWTTTATSFADFSTKTLCTYSVTGLASAPSTNIPAIKFSSLPAGDYKIEYEGFIYSNGSTSTDNFFRFFDGANATREQSNLFLGSANQSTTGISHSISYSTSQSNITLSLQGKVSSGGSVNVYGTAGNPGTIRVWYFPPASKIYSQASQDYDWTAYTPTSPNSSLTSITSTACVHKRKGSDLYLKCRFTPGGLNASPWRIALPNSLVIGSVGTSGTFIPGKLWRNRSETSDTQYTILATAGNSYIEAGLQNGGVSGNPLVAINANTAFNASEAQYFETGPIPIQGWSDYGVIVGSFAGIEKCANDYECTDTFSATIDASGNISNENIDWLSGTTCPLSGVGRLCSYQAFLKDGTSALSSAMNCVATPVYDATAVSVGELGISSSTTSGININTTVSGAGNNVTGFHLKCQKGSQDYKPKTAKVASSIGVPTVPGITTQAIDTFMVSFGGSSLTSVCSASPCYVDQLGQTPGTSPQGGAVSTITRTSSATYNLNANKTYSKLKCSGHASNLSNFLAVGGTTSSLTCTNCSVLPFQTGTGPTAADGFGTLYCQGSY